MNFSVYMPEADYIESKTLLFLDEIQECPEAITCLDMYPMTFEEFLWACNISHKTIEELRRHFTDRTKISDAINDKIKAERCYDSIPKQLSKRNHKFQYSVVEKGGNARKYKTSLDWLIGAYLVVMCYNTERMVVPLKSRLIDNDFRLYASDIGLTTAMFI